ncbi:MAG: ribosome-associated translation inhibitor RaiA [Patescibacteria group bacterium]
MSVTIKKTNAKVSPSELNYVNKNLEKLKKFLRPENNIHVELQNTTKHKTGLIARAEVTIMPKPGIYADAYGNDFFEAIDLCLPKIKEQLMKSKDKVVSQRRRLGAQRKDSR